MSSTRIALSGPKIKLEDVQDEQETLNSTNSGATISRKRVRIDSAVDNDALEDTRISSEDVKIEDVPGEFPVQPVRQ